MTSSKLLYLHDQSMMESQGIILAGVAANDGRFGLVLDQTVFYPQGGGQPSDIGTIKWDSGTMDVSAVKNENGKVIHWGTLQGSEPDTGKNASLSVDRQLREKNTRIHSAGELICAAVHMLGRAWKVTAANHFPGSSKVVYDATLGTDVLARFQKDLSDKLEHLISSNIPVVIKSTTDMEEAREYCGELPIGLSDGEEVRMVFIVPGFCRPCMGTHVQNTGAIGKITLRSVKCKGGQLSIGYDLAT
jgi:Ser-tRNA(Ala) deacylase AlaX